MIRFSAALVVVGLGLLLAGALTSELPLVYAAIVVCVIATILLATGVIAGREEILGRDLKATEATGESGRETAVQAPASAPAAATVAPPPAEETSPASSGLGWPAGKSPADALWARVDAELSAAGASVDTPKLTKDSASEEVWGRVELELTTPAKWGSQVHALHQGTGSAPTDHPASYEPIMLPHHWEATDDLSGPDDLPVAAPDPDVSRFSLSPRRTGDLSDTLPADRDEPGGPPALPWQPASHDEAPGEAVIPDPADEASTGDQGSPRAEDGPESEPDSLLPSGHEAEADAEPADEQDATADQDADAEDDHDVAASAGESPSDEGSSAESAAPEGPADESPADESPAAESPVDESTGGEGTAVESTAAEDEPAPLPAPTPRLSASGLPQRKPNASPLGQRGTGSGSPLFPQGKSDPSPLPSRGPGFSPLLSPKTESPAPFSPSQGDASPGGASQGDADPAGASQSGADQGGASQGEATSNIPARVVLVPGVPRYHRVDCILIRFLSTGDIETVTREAAQAAGCVPCRACEPDTELGGTG